MTPEAPLQVIDALLVEDDPGDAKLVELHAARIHDLIIRFRKASTLAEAEQHLKSDGIQAVLLDLGLPDSTGTDSVKRMTQAAGDRPVIVLTGLADSHTVSRVLEEGAQDYLLKDLLTPELLRKTLLYSVRYRGLLNHLIRSQEDLTRMNRIKDEFLAVVSHELRTPLTSIVGYLKLLSRQCRDRMGAEQAEYFDVIQRNADRLLDLINSLLDLSKLGRNPDAARPKSHPIRSLVERILKSFAGVPEAAAHPIEIEPSGGGDLAVWADGPMLEQVLTNLVSNALKYSRPGKPVHLGYRREQRENREGTLLWVRDEGEGIAESDRNRIFDKFYQAEQHVTRKTGGLGLGLAIVKSIMDQHHGQVWVESRPGQGSTFFAFFPDPSPS